MNTLLISLKVLFIAALNVFLGSIIYTFLFGEYIENQYGRYTVIGPDWLEWPIKISGFVIVALVLLAVAYWANKALMGLLFRQSQLVNPAPAPNHVDLIFDYIETRCMAGSAPLDTEAWLTKHNIAASSKEAVIIQHVAGYFYLKNTESSK